MAHASRCNRGERTNHPTTAAVRVVFCYQEPGAGGGRRSLAMLKEMTFADTRLIYSMERNKR